MRRADRLLQIVQILRRRGVATTALTLADELEVVPRTIYRDIAVLKASRVPIDGEAGVGYVLREGYDLPPLMFNTEEIEAAVLGLRMVVERGDRALVRGASDVLAKIQAVVPKNIADQMGKAAASASSFGSRGRIWRACAGYSIGCPRKLQAPYRLCRRGGSIDGAHDLAARTLTSSVT